jgi:hypothetical protein
VASQLAAACAALLTLAQASPPEGAARGQTGDTPDAPPPEAPAELARGKTGVAPVELIPRIELRHHYASLQGGGAASTTAVRMDIDFLGRLLLNYEVPYRRLANAAGEQVSGLGDIELRAIGVMTASPIQVTALVAGVQLDTATQPRLGTGKHVLLVGAAAALKIRRWWLPYLLAEEQVSVGGDDARPAVNRLAVRLGNVVFGPGLAWLKLDLDTLVDFHDGGTTRLFTSLEAGRLLIGRVGVFLRGATQALGPRDLDYSVEAGARYLFRLDRMAPR